MRGKTPFLPLFLRGVLKASGKCNKIRTFKTSATMRVCDCFQTTKMLQCVLHHGANASDSRKYWEKLCYITGSSPVCSIGFGDSKILYLWEKRRILGIILTRKMLRNSRKLLQTVILRIAHGVCNRDLTHRRCRNSR